MGNKAISIGINKYEFLHPLKWASNDALHMRDFLLDPNNANFEKVWYFSDDSIEVNGMTTRPTRSNLRKVLNELSQGSPLSETDTVWFFFAGHGILHDGVDYLMPSDGNPDDLADTAISTNFVLQRLRNCGAGNIVLALDACRNQVRRDGRGRSGMGIGGQTVTEANKVADTICFSACSPNEFSHEPDDLQHGAFTYALVEGLGIQGKCATVEKLSDYLKHRVPVLAKAKQTPRVAIDPIEKGHLILMPKYASKHDLATLKNDAHRAERLGNLSEARLLWRRVLAVDGTDSDAFMAIEVLAIKTQSMPQPNLSDSQKLATGNQRQASSQPTAEESKVLSLDCGNGVMLDLVRIPAGSFKMGSDAYDREKPIYDVMLKEFWMGKYAVTQQQWQAVMGTNPSNFQGENLPVEKLSWHDARTFCQKLSKKTGKEVRLPTEAEWEYACRAGTNTAYAFGSTLTPNQANFGNQKRTVDVDSFAPNAWGLYQMHGNVWEWCLDEYHENYSAKSDRLKKNGDEAWGDLNVHKEDKRLRLLRGGSWVSDPDNCRSACRVIIHADGRSYSFGFRVACLARGLL